jgi:protein Tex
VTEALLSAMRRRFASHAETLPTLLPVLLSEDPTPFLARYRRGALGGVPEPRFRKLRQAAREERELSRRRQSLRRALEEQGVLTEELAALLEDAGDPAVLDDIARPLRTAKAPAAERPPEDPMRPVARQVLDAPTPAEGTTAPTVAEILAPYCGEAGAAPTADDQRARLVRLVADLIGEDPRARRAVRATGRRSATVTTSLGDRRTGKDAYRPFADMSKPLSGLPPRMLLLLRRGQKAGAVKAKLTLPEVDRAALLSGPLAPAEGHPYADVVREAASDALDRVLLPGVLQDLLKERKRAAERSLLPLFAQALRDRLLAPPAGAVPVVAVVPGATDSFRILVVDAQGRAGTTVAVHPLPPRNEKEEAAKALLDAIRESGARLIAVASSGRAKALRAWVNEVLAANRDVDAVPIPVNEIAAVEHAESEADKLAAPELPATARVALSIGRLVQDPLSELLRYDLCDVPLGPNQRDVDRGELRRRLEETAESCVALVGADVNTAHVGVLARVPGLDPASAAKIVAWRTERGPFATRNDVRHVEGLDEQAWQRAAGFLRIRDGVDPLDATGVHPTGAIAVPAIAAKLAVEPNAVIGRADLLAPLDAKEFAGPVLTEDDVRSVLDELGHGSADPRGPFVQPAFNPGVTRGRDLAAEMELEGVVTSLSKFGAFVDVGVGQDGLVHVSELAHQFVRDPSDVVQVGQKVRVKVMGVDPAKRRISLSIKALVAPPPRPEPSAEDRPQRTFGPRRDGVGERREGGPGGPPGGPRRPRRPRPEGAEAGGERRGPGRFQPERPGTAPRRMQRRGRFGARGGKDAVTADGEVDLSRDSATGSLRDLTGGGRGGRPPRGGGGPRREAPPGPRDPSPAGLDPFQQQLAALKAKLGLAAQTPATPAESPAPDQPAQ